MWKKIVGIIAFVSVSGILIALKHIDNAVTEYYSPGFVSESIAEARSQKIFISQPLLKSNVIRWKKSKYPIREAWIEQATKIKYDWIFFRRVIPTGYRLILIVERTGSPPGQDFLYFNDELVCNNSIRVSNTQPSTPLLIYSNVLSAVPGSIDCLVKK